MSLEQKSLKQIMDFNDFWNLMIKYKLYDSLEQTYKPTNTEKIEGMEGVLLRAEEAITKGNLEKAISEINSLEIESRGVLDAWLKEAKAKKDASVAAENILAKTTAALKIKN